MSQNSIYESSKKRPSCHYCSGFTPQEYGLCPVCTVSVYLQIYGSLEMETCMHCGDLNLNPSYLLCSSCCAELLHEWHKSTLDKLYCELTQRPRLPFRSAAPQTPPPKALPESPKSLDFEDIDEDDQKQKKEVQV